MNMPHWLNQTTGRIWAILRLAVKNFSDIDGTQSAGAFAHFTFFSLFPLIVIFVTIAGVSKARGQASAIAFLMLV